MFQIWNIMELSEIELFEEELWNNCSPEIEMDTLKIAWRTLQMPRSKFFGNLILGEKN